MTKLDVIYDRFLGRITDDMYMEWNETDTKADLKNIFQDAVSGFEFPRFPLYDYDLEAGVYNVDLTQEEINIFSELMLIVWLQRQITTVENTRMKYSGQDFKLTSQANHLSKLLALKADCEKVDRHFQRLYKRRRFTDDKGTIESNWNSLMENSAFD